MNLQIFLGNYLEPIAYLIYLIAILLYFIRDKNKIFLCVLVYYGCAFCLMATTSIIIVATNYDTIWLYNLLSFCTIILLGTYFYQLLNTSFKKKTVTALIVVNVIFGIIKNLLLHELHLFNSIGYGLVAASMAVFVFMYFHQVLKHVTNENIFRNFNFWLTCSYLIYFLGSFIIFLSYYHFTAKIMATYTNEERHLLTALWAVHNLLLFVSALSLLIGSIWLTYRRKSV